jgi:tetratricopeptide (TPR) repeat protein
MRRRFPTCLWAAALAACLILAPSRLAGADGSLSGGVSDLVFHLTTYDERSNPLLHGQGIVVGPRGDAIVSMSTLEGATFAVATMMDGSTLSVREVLAVDETTGLAKIRLERGAPSPSEKLVESQVPQVGERIIFSFLTDHGDQVCVESGISLIKKVPDLEGLYYVETSRRIPPLGGSVFSSEGSLAGMVVMRFGKGDSGLLASGERLSTLAIRRGQKITLDRWANRKDGRWGETVYARYMRGQAALWQGQPVAVLDLENSFQSLPDLQASVAALLGEAYLAMDLLPEAILAFRASIELDSPPCRAYRKLAWVYMETGQYAAAEAMCYKAIRIDPALSAGYTLLAHLRNLQGEFKQAVYEARRALKRDPNCPCAHFERGRGYIGLGRYQDAIESLKTATTLDPMYGEAFSSLGYAYLRSGKPLHAVVVLKEAVEVEPEGSAAWGSLGEAYSRAGLHGKAMKALRQAVCLDPSRSHGYSRLAREYLKQGNHQEAAETLRQGIDQCEECQWLVYYLGKTYCKEGRVDLAREQADLLYRENRKLAGQLLRIINLEPRG